MSSKPIGIFDSGVGGLSVLLEMHKILPLETTIYVADQAYIPYGKRTKEELVDRVGKIMAFFKEKDVKAVVAACNTASVYAVDEMRNRLEFPIISTVPVVKTISNLTKTKKTAVLSTPATAKSPYLDFLIEKYANGVHVEKVGGSNLEEYVERGDLSSPRVRVILNRVLQPLIKDGIDAIALGCTHYPFLKDQIQKIVGPNVFVVDSGGAVSRRLHEILEHNRTLSLQKGTDQYYTTGDVQKFKKVAEKLMEQEIGEVEHINL